jgi:intracellular sulfur oxidation DsrE/DsrF family protein
LVNLLTSTRLVRRVDVSIILVRPGAPPRTAAIRPSGTEVPRNLAGNRQIETLIKEGAKVYACRFAMGALYGFREEDLIDGVQAFSPLDVLDSALTAWRAGAFQLNTWTV